MKAPGGQGERKGRPRTGGNAGAGRISGRRFGLKHSPGYAFAAERARAWK
ncbi:MAG: hypothetical protein WCI75_21080 [candidate division NC10 bacterium]